MGQSTDALFWYGYCWAEEGEIEGSPPPWKTEDEDCDEDEFLAKKRGVAAPTVAFSEATKPLYHDYWKIRDAAEKASPCKIVRHCHGDVRMYGVAIKASYVEASRGNPEALDLQPEKAEWDEQLVAFMALLGVKTEQKPKWWLASDWD